MEDLEAFVVFNHIPHLGPAKTRKLLENFGSAGKILETVSDKIAEILGKNDKSLSYLSNWQTIQEWQKDLELVSKSNVKLIPFTHSSYPKTLLTSADHPLILYVRGALLPQDEKSISVIGTRECSHFGRDVTKKIAKELAAAGLTVISGLARGIDTAAILGALESGRAIGIMGAGLGTPHEIGALASHIAYSGAVISEFPMNTLQEKIPFNKRFRLLGALSQAALLTEAPLKSGAMVTMNLAHSLEKKCFVLPGHIDLETCQGNQALIKEKKAQLVENVQEILSFFGLGGNK